MFPNLIKELQTLESLESEQILDIDESDKKREKIRNCLKQKNLMRQAKELKKEVS